MRGILLRRWRWALWGAVLLAGVGAAPAQAAPPATVAYCGFTPTQGGPGTVVHVEVFQWFNSQDVAVGFAVPKTPGAATAPPGGPIPADALVPLGPSLATIALTQGGGEATFRIPA